ncbi:MAG: ATP-binding protein [Planctomycetes bacterium]|nr:ATP-binding protein [Planctomycetota bacterium]
MTRHPFSESQVIFQGEIASRLEERERLIAQVLDKLREAGCRLDPFFDRLCLDEALANAILHGNRQDPAKKVTVRVFCAPRRWGVEVADEGQGYDWQRAVARARGGVDFEPSGRGLGLILSSGADVCFFDGGRRLLMVRQRDASSGQDVSETSEP